MYLNVFPLHRWLWQWSTQQREEVTSCWSTAPFHWLAKGEVLEQLWWRLCKLNLLQVCGHGHHWVGGLWASRQRDGPHRNRYPHSTPNYSSLKKTLKIFSPDPDTSLDAVRAATGMDFKVSDGLTKMAQLWWPDQDGPAIVDWPRWPGF